MFKPNKKMMLGLGVAAVAVLAPLTWRLHQLNTVRADYSSALDYQFSPAADYFAAEDPEQYSERMSIFLRHRSCERLETFFFKEVDAARKMLAGLKDYRGMHGASQLDPELASNNNFRNEFARVGYLATDLQMYYVIETSPSRMRSAADVSGEGTPGYSVRICKVST
ncbi:hypothetical protein [Deinococcus sp. DB0503]|uniref:hypothetical protein n=1 Tax=Deinococcus sp. DB0503 TaxID=2479203 RepID=UPI0018DFE18F|nr:hypothetical protein [Deinococcus sp. DB0503]MBI0445355.1 hypothetical protein [Deinococcus sp. DB0503]